MIDTSLKLSASGRGLTIRGRGEALGVSTGDGEGGRDVVGVDPLFPTDRIDRDDGVRGRAENRFKLFKVALNGLLLPLPLDGVRTSSPPLCVLGGGNGGSGGERTVGERDALRESGKRCAFPLGEEPIFVSRTLTQLGSRRSSIAGRRVCATSASESGSTTGRLTAVGERYALFGSVAYCA